MKNDWIALVEASYDLDGSDQDWLDRLFDRAEPLLDPGIGRGASNFLGTKNPVNAIRQLTEASGYQKPSGEQRSYLLIDGAQLVPGTFIDFRDLGADYLAFSFHKMLAPFGVGVLVAREPLLEASPPFLYGGDMVAEGQVSADGVAYNVLPWKDYAAGTPNIIGTIFSAQALRLLLDLALTPTRAHYFGSDRPIAREAVEGAMGRVAEWNRQHTDLPAQRRPEPARG